MTNNGGELLTLSKSLQQTHESGSRLNNDSQVSRVGIEAQNMQHVEAVSYTHLTLPTIYSV